MMIRKCLILAALGLSLFWLVSCSKDLPSSPGAPAGQPVTVTGNPDDNMSRQIQFKYVKVTNNSQRTIYQVRIAVTTWLGPPQDSNLTTVTGVLFPSIAHGTSGTVSNIPVPGDRFIGAEALWDWIAP